MLTLPIAFRSVPLQVADDALRIVINKNYKLFPKSKMLYDMVAEYSKKDLKLTSAYAKENSAAISAANEEIRQGMEKDDLDNMNPLAPLCDLEKEVMPRCRRTVNLFLALCKEYDLGLLSELLEVASDGDDVEVLAKAVRIELPKFVKGAAKKHGEAVIADRVAANASEKETPLLLALLDNLAPSNINQVRASVKVGSSSVAASSRGVPCVLVLFARRSTGGWQPSIHHC